MQQLKDALAMVLPVEQLYWLTLNGTVHIYSLSKQLLTAGFVAQMLPFLLFCVRSLDQHVTFSTAKYLPWRTQLYSTLCYAYGDAGAFAAAKKVVQVRTGGGRAVGRACWATGDGRGCWVLLTHTLGGASRWMECHGRAAWRASTP